MPSSTTTPPALTRQLLASCRELADHLHAYTFTPDAAVYDEDAVIAIERAERLLHEAGHLAGPPEQPQADPEEDDDEDTCGDCRCRRSEAEGDEGWNPDAEQCFSCVESVYRLAEKFGLTTEDDEKRDEELGLDHLEAVRAKLWEARRGPLKDQIEACLTFRT